MAFFAEYAGTREGEADGGAVLNQNFILRLVEPFLSRLKSNQNF